MVNCSNRMAHPIFKTTLQFTTKLRSTHTPHSDPAYKFHRRDELSLPKRIRNPHLQSEPTKTQNQPNPMKKETSGPVLRPFPAAARFHSPISSPGTSPFAASTNFGFSSGSSTFFQNHDDHNHHRPTSPTRVNISSTPLSRSVRFSIDHRSGSPSRSITVSNRNSPVSLPKKPCMCSPTTHPGSFRCSLHKKSGSSGHHQASSAYSSSGLNMRRSAMTNSLVRIGGVEGDWVKRALTALIRPSSHQLRRRANFRPQPSRLSVMSTAENLQNKD